MNLVDWAAMVVGSGLIGSGFRAIRRRKAHVPEEYTGTKAALLGWLWVGLGTLFLLAVLFDIAILKAFFRLFLEAAN